MKRYILNIEGKHEIARDVSVLYKGKDISALVTSAIYEVIDREDFDNKEFINDAKKHGLIEEVLEDE